ncbi:uncharacterized protein EDB91DRAFT_1272409 [Suillus paluster]|uniref:uncharacterized protein n=1 Tax=Suillus paluster TaxID=48578 RepID=UPI001B8654B3|nr:uncharacterized protein EDB91DRAFT_1272409 [Suillus paluster]KAG1744520.1 hypothetical protein EDB91DRAFT_1272409 [Suillus paluster]
MLLAITVVELPIGQWPDLIKILLSFINTSDDTNLKIATLQAIGYICKIIKPEVLALRSNKILTAVIHGAHKEEPSLEVQLTSHSDTCRRQTKAWFEERSSYPSTRGTFGTTNTFARPHLT